MAFNDKQVQELLAEGIINQEQAEKIAQKRKEGASGNIIMTLSVVGAVFLGIGALLFVGSNWQEISAFGKVAILVGATFGAYWSGYFMAYQRKNFPKVGQALLFLGALLFGASVFLIAQIYNVEADSRTLLLIWLAGVLPLVYLLRFEATAALATLIFYGWFISMVTNAFGGFSIFNSRLDVIAILSSLIVISLIVFLVGALHYRIPVLEPIARIYRLSAIRLAMAAIFIMTFRGVYEYLNYGYRYYGHQLDERTVPAILAIGAVLALLGGAAAMVFNPAKSIFPKLENGIVAGLGLLTLGVLYVPSANQLFPIIFNLVFAGLIAALFWIGYQKHQMALVNIAMGSTVVLIFARYFDFFWDMLPASGFFLGGGALLLLGGIALERKRRDIKQQFAATA